MARKRRISCFVLQVWHLYLFWIHLQSSICVAKHVSNSKEASVKHPDNISGIYLKSSNDVTIRVGELLKLNCSLVGAVNTSQIQLFWYYGDQCLSNLTRKLTNKTIQLVIDRVSWNNSGTYVCKEKGSNRVKPMSVMVTVGDIPSPPQDVWINNFEFRTYIHWKAPLNPGGLSLNYVVKGQCQNTVNMSAELPECKLEYITLCSVIKREQEPGSNGFVCKVNARLHQFVFTTSHEFTTFSYIAHIEAVNILGLGMSTPVEFSVNLSDQLSTTPQPAVFLDARQEVSQPGTVKLTWQDAKQDRPMEVEYTILYHKDGDNHNKSVTVKAPRTNVLISDLVGFSWYHFYLLVRYGARLTAENTYGIYSEAVERKVRTNISAPKPPVITNCTQWSSLNTDSGLTVTWTIPNAEYFNGPLRNAVVLYRCQKGGELIFGNVTVSNTTVRSVVIHAVKPSDKCHLWMKLCNEPSQLCSGISSMCLFPGIAKDHNSSSTSKNSKRSVVRTVLVILAGTGGGFILVSGLVLCYRMRQRKNIRRPLADVLNLPQVHGYNEMEEPPTNECYDEIVVQPMDKPTEADT